MFLSNETIDNIKYCKEAMQTIPRLCGCDMCRLITDDNDYCELKKVNNKVRCHLLNKDCTWWCA